MASDLNPSHIFSILFVDDEKFNQVAFHASFREYYTIYLASTAKEALVIMENENIDLLISDQRMPEMSGVELFEQVQAKFPDIIRILITAYSDLDTIVDAVNRGKIYYFIPKPWRQEEFRLIMDRALETSWLLKENRRLEEERMRLALLEEEREKEVAVARMVSLRNQLNPHFLFNSFSTIYSLVDTDSERARSYVLKLSRFYRDLLEEHNDDLATIIAEVDLASRFVELQQVRFGSCLTLTFATETFNKGYLPVQSLLLLVENAIKHNIATLEAPLSIQMSIRDGYFFVENPYQLRSEKIERIGLGQLNLVSRFELLGSEPPKFGIQNGVYYARLPIIYR